MVSFLLAMMLMAPALTDSLDGAATVRSRQQMDSVLRYGNVSDGRALDGGPGSTGAPLSASRASGRRHVALAFAASAVLPGAGQVYNRQWVKAGLALSAEALVTALYLLKRSDGLAAEDDVYAFAHSRWSAARYADWLNDYVDYLEQEYAHSVTAPPAMAPTGIDLSRPDSWSAAERADVNRFFSQIQAIERQVFHPETGATFSHQLPGFAEQQYYELIGKYFQFAPGWDDYPAWVDAQGTFTDAIDPEMTGPGGSKPNVSDTFRAYAEDHAHSQDLLRTASRLSMLFIVNHLVAAVDAAVSAKLHNDRLNLRSGLSLDPSGGIVPVAAFSWRF